MSETKFDTERILEYKKKINTIREYVLKYQTQIQDIIDTYKSDISDIDNSYISPMCTLENVEMHLNGLMKGIDSIIERYEVHEGEAKDTFGGVEVDDTMYGCFNVFYAPTRERYDYNPNYESYSVYNFTMNGYDIGEYDVRDNILTFMNSAGAGYLQFANITHWNTYAHTINSALFGDSDVTTSDYARIALKAVLDSLNPVEESEIVETLGEYEDFFKALDKFDGNMEKLLKILQADSEIALHDALFCNNGEDDGLAALRVAVGAMTGEQVEWLLKVFGAVKNITGTITVGADTLDLLVAAEKHILSDYTRQISYLDTIENSLDAMGYQAVDVRNAVGIVREQYNNLYIDMLYQNEGKIEGFITGKIAKEGLEWIGVPALSQASSVLSLSSGLVGIMEKGNIAAADTLYGLVQYDNALSNQLAQYQEMMRDGTISKDDMEEAQRLFEIIKATKEKEYESLITLKENGYNVGDISLSTLKNQLRDLQGV